MAIKTIVFQCHAGGAEVKTVAREAAISSNLTHTNIVATYSHDIVAVSPAVANELAVFKFYLIQVSSLHLPSRHLHYTSALYGMSHSQRPVLQALPFPSLSMIHPQPMRQCHSPTSYR